MAMDFNFLAGVIEGFYGQPWSQAERLQLFDWMREWSLNTYLYAPKDDLKHRSLWRELYNDAEAEALQNNVANCALRGIRFIYGIAPGLDIQYSDDREITALKAKLEQLQKLGCRNFAILFDDIPDLIKESDGKKFGSFASAQCHVANTLLGLIEADRFLFCPTPYCGRMAGAKLGGENYLATIGKELSPKIDVFWTGPDIVSREITVEHVRTVSDLLKRKPLLWDNLHANDYDGRRFYVGPYSGRPPELKKEVAGILNNPNSEFELNYTPIRTLADFIHDRRKNPRERYLEAMRAWFPQFKTVRGEIDFEELVLLGDCFYLPFEDGNEAQRLFKKIEILLRDGGSLPEAVALRNLLDLCIRLSDLENRALFHSLSRRIWELKEELDLIIRYLEGSKRSDFHLPGTYRGGFVARLQTLLKQKPDGSFEP